MLPPGIYLWTPGQDSLSPRTDFNLIKMAHPFWKGDIDAFGPWERDESTGLDGCAFKSSMSTKATLVVVESCSSTMEVARCLTEEGLLGPWGAVIAVRQDCGRGQLRRHWVSSPGNLHASIVLPHKPEEGAWKTELDSLLPVLVGYLFCEILNELGGAVELKWPNDILQENRKVGGVLIEERNDLSIVGVGMNLAEFPSDEMMREDCSVFAGKLQMSSGPPGPLGLLEILVSRGKSMYIDVLDELQPEQFVSVVAKLLAWLGRSVLVHEGSQPPYEAVLVGISRNGGLVVRCSGNETVLYSGSIIPL